MSLSKALAEARNAYMDRTTGLDPFLVMGPRSRRGHQIMPESYEPKGGGAFRAMVFAGKQMQHDAMTYCQQPIDEQWVEAPSGTPPCVRCIEREMAD